MAAFSMTSMPIRIMMRLERHTRTQRSPMMKRMPARMRTCIRGTIIGNIQSPSPDLRPPSPTGRGVGGEGASASCLTSSSQIQSAYQGKEELHGDYLHSYPVVPKEKEGEVTDAERDAGWEGGVMGGDQDQDAPQNDGAKNCSR